MKHLRRALPAILLATLLAAVPAAASADQSALHVSALYNNHTMIAVPGAFTVLVRNGHRDAFLIHATDMVPGPVTADVFVYNNPAACSGSFTTAGFPGRCGGPPPSPAVCAAHPFDSCNPATGFQLIGGLPAGTASAGGFDHFLLRVPGVENPKGAELQLYIKSLDQPFISKGQTKLPKAFAFFAAPPERDSD